VRLTLRRGAEQTIFHGVAILCSAVDAHTDHGANVAFQLPPVTAAMLILRGRFPERRKRIGCFGEDQGSGT
jgi:hypothetical protein